MSGAASYIIEMALTSTSTIEEIKAAYIDNAAYDVNNSVAQAKLFVQACRILLLVMPKQGSQDRANFGLSPELIAEQLKDATAFCGGHVDATAADGTITGGTVRHFDLSNLRGLGGNGGGG